MGRLLIPNQNSKINLQGNITIPTLVSAAGNSENFVFLPTDNIYFEAEVYLNSYNNVGTIIEATSLEEVIVNEFEFGISDVTELGNRGIPQGSFFAYNGERGNSLSAYYTSSFIVNLNTWTKVAAQRINGVWSMFINNTQQTVSRFVDDGIPNDQFGNANLPVWIGRSEVGDFNIDGQIRNVILSNKLIKKNKISIKKQNTGNGKINLKPRTYLYKATGTGLTPNINGLRFYNTGVIDPTFGLPIYYDETNTYTIIRRSIGGQLWSIETISNPGNILWGRAASLIPGAYFPAGGGASGTVTISAI